MSKTSPKKTYTQLKEWLKSRGTTTTSDSKKPQRKFSKADHYKKVNNRYGNKKSN